MAGFTAVQITGLKYKQIIPFSITAVSDCLCWIRRSTIQFANKTLPPQGTDTLGVTNLKHLPWHHQLKQLDPRTGTGTVNNYKWHLYGPNKPLIERHLCEMKNLNWWD